MDASPLTSVVVCLSGGPDSILCAEIARTRVDHSLAAGFFLDYGQPAKEQELMSATTYCNARKVRLFVASVSLEGMQSMRADSGATGPRIVPGRNGIIISLALNVAASIGAQEVWYGAISDDSTNYPDCSSDWIAKMNVLAQSGNNPPLRVRAPIKLLRKSEVLAELDARGIELAQHWSCYSPVAGMPCLRCNSCLLRNA